MKKLIILSIIALYLSVALKAQENEPRMLIMGVPQYLFINGLRLDFDYRLKNSKNWLVFSPQYFNYTSTFDINDAFSLNQDYITVNGAGMYVTYKKFLSKRASQGIYIAGGAGYNYFDVYVNGRVWDETEINGIKQYVSGLRNYTVSVNKLGINALLGSQYKIGPVYADFYIGFGLRYSNRSMPDNATAFLNATNSDYGYTGTLFVGGFRIGMPLIY